LLTDIEQFPDIYSSIFPCAAGKLINAVIGKIAQHIDILLLEQSVSDCSIRVTDYSIRDALFDKQGFIACIWYKSSAYYAQCYQAHIHI